MIRRLGPLFLTGIVTSLSPTANKGSANSKATQSVCRDDSRALVSPPLLEVVMRPERYNHCIVAVAGFVEVAQYSGRLYVSREDLLADGVLIGAVHLSLDGARQGIVDWKRFKTSSRQLIHVRGLLTVGGSPDNPGEPSIDHLEELNLGYANTISFPGDAGSYR
jgi:hypothetical protein